jgi:hypothetical protein
MTIMVKKRGSDRVKLHRKKAIARILAMNLLKPPASAHPQHDHVV